MRDFKIWIDGRKESGEKVIILIDANQTIQEETAAYDLKNPVANSQLNSVMEDAYLQQTLRSADQGTTIDHIISSGIDKLQVSKAGQLPFGLGFASDHRAMFANVHTEELLQIYMEEPEEREGR